MPECHMKNESCGFRCTGYNGSAVWEELHRLPKKIDCAECSDHADFEFRGLHDHVNLGLGKQAYDKQTYNEWVNEVQCTFNRCKKEGRC